MTSVSRFARKTLRAATPLVLIGPPGVLIAYTGTFLLTPDSGVTGDFYASASQIIPVLLLVLAIEGEVFRWRMAGPSVLRDERIGRAVSGKGGVGAAVGAAVDLAVETADAVIRQLTALLLLAALLVGEVVALVPLLTGDAESSSAKPVMAAVVAGLYGVAYVAITGSPFLRSPGESNDEGESN
jgi:hypothetical protein